METPQQPQETSTEIMRLVGQFSKNEAGMYFSLVEYGWNNRHRMTVCKFRRGLLEANLTKSRVSEITVIVQEEEVAKNFIGGEKWSVQKAIDAARAARKTRLEKQRQARQQQLLPMAEDERPLAEAAPEEAAQDMVCQEAEETTEDKIIAIVKRLVEAMSERGVTTFECSGHLFEWHSKSAVTPS